MWEGKGMQDKWARCRALATWMLGNKAAQSRHERGTTHLASVWYRGSEHEQVVCGRVAEQQQVIGRVLVVGCNIEGDHPLQCNLCYPVPREQSVPLHVEELAVIRVRQHGRHSRDVVCSVEAQQVHEP